MASAPMPARKFSPYCSCASRYSASLRSWRLLQRGLAGIDDDVILVIDDALQLPGAHVEHQAQAGGHALVEPDVRDGHGQFDVAHALAAHAARASLPRRNGRR